MSDTQAWHNVGHKFAPKEPWDGILKNPGTMDVTIQGERSDSYTGKVNITIQPSLRISPGVYILINDDFELKSHSTETSGVDQMLKILASEFANSLEKQRTVPEKLLAL